MFVLFYCLFVQFKKYGVSTVHGEGGSCEQLNDFILVNHLNNRTLVVSKPYFAIVVINNLFS